MSDVNDAVRDATPATIGHAILKKQSSERKRTLVVYSAVGNPRDNARQRPQQLGVGEFCANVEYPILKYFDLTVFTLLPFSTQ